ncbi:MAG: plastocyanin/azurin family copper-binding protein [bacterium]
MKVHSQRLFVAASLFTLGVVAACGGDKSAAKDTAAAPPSPSASSAPGGAAPSPGPGGKIIVVQLITDGTGNRFEPNTIAAKKGDLIRYTLQAGVHNVHFLADSNPGKSGLPAASDLLQLPGQTYDVLVSFAPGTYYFHCDPHALLGMKGHLTVAP